jgi:predicted nucleic acid-binding protein
MTDLGQPDPLYCATSAEAVSLVQEASELFLSPIVLGELRSGFLKGGRASENERLLQEFLASPRCSVPEIDDETAHRYAVIHDHLRRQGTPVSPNDLWIAASAGQHGLTVATPNGDFDRIPQVMVRRLGPGPAPHEEEGSH